MIQGFYSAKSGTGGFQKLLDVTANNIANASTVGYKTQRTAFTDLMYAEMANTLGVEGGSGVRVSSVSANLEQGMLTETGNVLDCAIKGDGYFCVADENGGLHYTRAGNFALSTVDGVNYLVNADGYRVLDRNFQPITVAGNADDIIYSGSANAGGTVFPAIVTFENPYALTEEGGGLLAANAQSGAATLLDDATLVQGRLEFSNVNLAQEMVKMIQGQRCFQMNAKMVQTADEVEAMANTLRG